MTTSGSISNLWTLTLVYATEVGVEANIEEVKLYLESSK